MYKSIRFLPGRHPLENTHVCRTFELARGFGKKIYLVGGYLRDSIDIGRARLPSRKDCAKDLDFAVEGGGAVALGRQLADALSGHFVLLDEVNDIARVVLEDRTTYIDLAGFTGDIVSDLRRRDFTVNAMAFADSDAADDENDQEIADSRLQIIDPCGGLEDLGVNIIRAVSEDVLVDDPLRLLRAYRFACSLGATIDSATRACVAKHVNLLSQVARERVSYEFFTMMESPVGGLAKEMGRIGLLEAVYPELSGCRRVTPNSFHHLPLFDHSVETLPQLEARLPTLAPWVADSCANELSGGISRLAATKVACLLHDIGKPDTWAVTDEGRHTFIGHDKLGAEMVKPLADREKWSRQVSRFVEKLVLWHLRPGQLFHTARPTVKALNRFYRTVAEDVPELLLLAFADFGATCGPGLSGDDRLRLENSLLELLDGYPAYLENTKLLPKLIDGSDVMRLLGISPSPLIGEILGALHEAQEMNEVTNRAQAEAFVLSYRSGCKEQK